MTDHRRAADGAAPTGSAGRRPRRRPPRPLGTPLSLSLVVVIALATFGGFSTSFGVMTDCTNTFSCSVTECRPCVGAASWLEADWKVQGVLLLIGLVLAVLTRRGVRSRVVRWAGWLLGPVSIALMIATTSLATSSF
ncbi:hypothetical protein DQ239_17510 [Blastococcus sp. TF02-09]|uniref:hypothetical protein n=1 Tax=Blastococcus sp. TF02-09 TaxID=2250576 RepID=UPI000DE84717|nr:hypothetical protein [Blastococcus sp. TF02-9]RBY75142.1 hypothetical protein DQ239_17510 [Blastococcus sp. TF02-9]